MLKNYLCEACQRKTGEKVFCSHNSVTISKTPTGERAKFHNDRGPICHSPASMIGNITIRRVTR